VVGRYRLHFVDAVDLPVASDEEPVEAAG